MGSSSGILVTLLATLFALATASPFLIDLDLDFLFPQKTLVQKLFDKTAETQTLKEVPKIELFQWHEAKGVFQSEVRLNFHGSAAFGQFRRLFSIFDNNMFATAWVTSNLLEAYKYGAAPRPTDEQLTLALQAISKHVDRNADNTTSNLVFWPQVYNSTIDYWRTTPDNLVSLFETVDKIPFGAVESFLRTIGLVDVSNAISQLLDGTDMYLQAFRVPPDFDDTYVSLGLGSLLYEMKSDLSAAWNTWNGFNTNLNSLISSLKEHAYRPFSTNRDINTIDTRTYYYLRGFLDEAKANGEDIALATTWIQNLKQTRDLYAEGNPMPFNVNNVDVTVAADVVFGLTSAVLSGLVSPDVLEDPEIAQIYLNTSSLLAYEIATNLSSRPDLALTYYPSAIEYYWFVARTVGIMETAYKKSGSFPAPVMEEVYTLLREVCQGAMTDAILEQKQYERKDKYYFDDFLGNNDRDLFNNLKKNYEDRIFTTAMAANALLYTWTVYDEITGVCNWVSSIPNKVKYTIEGIINWLSEYTLSDKYKPWNAFFSGSVKGFTALPFWYPGNRLEFLNGTVISNWTSVPTDPFFYGVEGHIPKDDYDAMIEEKHFGYDTPTVFPGYNSDGSYFPFWSSDSYTYSSVLVAVSRFENTQV